MRQCWRCRKRGDNVNIHHINGDQENEKPQNCLGLCKKCHDLVQRICDKCEDQRDCWVQKLQRCWGFEDSLPPIYFKNKFLKPVSEVIQMRNPPKNGDKPLKRPISISGLDSYIPKCLLCGKENIKFNPEKETICPFCTMLLVRKPRILIGGEIEDFEDWKIRIAD